MTATFAAAEYPLRLGTAGEFQAARDFFRRAEFNDITLLRALKMDSMADLGRVRWEEATLAALPAALRWCLNVFARGLQSDYQQSLDLCGGEVMAAFEALGLLRRGKKNSGAVVSPVWLYPVDGFVVVSDRRDDPDGNPFVAIPDVVFPAIYGGTLRFLQLLPELQQGQALDLCGGSGIGALRLARQGGAAATADVTERSAFFAEFNGRLNGSPIESLCGDLYSPVKGRQFDLITAHPPFVPATGPVMVYRDAGATGEAITQRVIAGMPDFLKAGGTGIVLCVACDSQEKTYEHRVRDWLGAAGGMFDIVFGLEKVLSVEDVVESLRKRGENIGEKEAQMLYERLKSSGTRQFVYGAVFLRRCAEPVTQKPLRIGLTLDGRPVDFDRVLAWRHHCRKPGFADWLADSRPRLATGLEMTARHVVRQGQLLPSQFVFSMEAGFKTAFRPDAWVVPLVARLEGDQSVREVFEKARAADELPDGFTLEPFLDLIQQMIERRLLEVDFPH